MEYWFKKSNYMSRFLSKESLDIIDRIKEKYRKLEEEASKPKPRKRRRK